MTEKRPTNWNKSTLLAYRETMKPTRIAMDNMRLSSLFDYAQKIPEAKSALKWAIDHNIDFHLDHSCGGCAGYYINSTGVIGLSDIIFENKIRAVGTLTHEIRHAWQDYHGLLVDDEENRLTQIVIQTALVEADAMAHADLARLQARKLNINDVQFSVLYDHDVQNDYLWSRFQEWYNLDYKTSFYCEYITKKRGKDLGLSHLSLPVVDAEIKDVKSNYKGMDLSTAHPVFNLGKRFHDAHDRYLKTRDKPTRDFFFKKALTPIWAMTCFVDPKEKPQALMQRVRTVENVRIG